MVLGMTMLFFRYFFNSSRVYIYISFTDTLYLYLQCVHRSWCEPSGLSLLIWKLYIQYAPGRTPFILIHGGGTAFAYYALGGQGGDLWFTTILIKGFVFYNIQKFIGSVWVQTTAEPEPNAIEPERMVQSKVQCFIWTELQVQFTVQRKSQWTGLNRTLASLLKMHRILSPFHCCCMVGWSFEGVAVVERGEEMVALC